MSTQFGLCAIGNAIVDIIAPASHEFIASQKEFGMQPGGMTLIDSERAKQLYALMGPATEMSGGSAGNTMAAYASFGGKGAYIGKVADDQLGKVFTHDIRAIGVHFDSVPLPAGGTPTAQCLILVTDDAQRTMNTYLGASVLFNSADVNEDIIKNSEITYLEGYLFDAEEAKEAFYKAAYIASSNERKLSLTLSDSFCVNRHRADFKKLVENHVDILFANESEITALYETSLDEAIEAIRKDCNIAAITCGANGSIIVSGQETVRVQAAKPQRVLDTTGAGDVYAAGFLYGMSARKSFAECGALGSLAAAEVIDHYGPRPAASLKDLSLKLAA